jgi:hypothetical protein
MRTRVTAINTVQRFWLNTGLQLQRVDPPPFPSHSATADTAPLIFVRSLFTSHAQIRDQATQDRPASRDLAFVSHSVRITGQYQYGRIRLAEELLQDRLA